MQRVLKIRESVFGLEALTTAQAMDNLAVDYCGLNQFDKARPLQERALSVRERVAGPQHPVTAVSLSNLSFTYAAIGEYDKAVEMQQRALAIREDVLGPEHPDTATSLNNLGVQYFHLKQFEKSRQLQERALAIREKMLGPVHPETAVSLSSFAVLLEALNQPEMSVGFFKAAVNSYQSQRERIAQIGSSEMRSFTSSHATTYQSLATVLTELGRLPEAQMVLDMLKEDEQFEFIRRSPMSDPRGTRIGYNSTEQVWMIRYRQISGQLAALWSEEIALQNQAKNGLTEQQKRRQQTLVADIKVAQMASDQFLQEMRERLVQQGGAPNVETEELGQQSMRAQQALMDSLGTNVVLLRYYITDDQLGILFSTSLGSLSRRTKVDAKALNRQIAEFRRLLQDPKSAPLPIAQALYKLLVVPVESDLEQAGAVTVMLSLDGALRYLPFGALHDGKQFLAQRLNLPIYTSVTKNRLLDSVNPSWNAAGLGVTRAHGDFAALPAVKGEMESIVKSSRSGVLSGEVYLDDAFTANRLRDVGQRKFQLMHVSSHFRFSPGTEVNSFLLLGDGQQLTLGDIRTQNYRFDNVDLLTLSACDTGLGGGRDERGREIEGFGVIAQQQGAKAVLATLWSVADKSTALLMANMYRTRQEQHLTKIEALRQAQLSLMAQPRYSHPFYWAPFILMGNWK
jgi:CHAT domain-containing protein/Tfp pilus assembly protein PilF